jgi:hypothetical protein
LETFDHMVFREKTDRATFASSALDAAKSAQTRLAFFVKQESTIFSMLSPMPSTFGGTSGATPQQARPLPLHGAILVN